MCGADRIAVEVCKRYARLAREERVRLGDATDLG